MKIPRVFAIVSMKSFDHHLARLASKVLKVGIKESKLCLPRCPVSLEAGHPQLNNPAGRGLIRQHKSTEFMPHTRHIQKSSNVALQWDEVLVNVTMRFHTNQLQQFYEISVAVGIA